MEYCGAVELCRLSELPSVDLPGSIDLENDHDHCLLHGRCPASFPGALALLCNSSEPADSRPWLLARHLLLADGDFRRGDRPSLEMALRLPIWRRQLADCLGRDSAAELALQSNVGDARDHRGRDLGGDAGADYLLPRWPAERSKGFVRGGGDRWSRTLAIVCARDLANDLADGVLPDGYYLHSFDDRWLRHRLEHDAGWAS